MRLFLAGFLLCLLHPGGARSAAAVSDDAAHDVSPRTASFAYAPADPAKLYYVAGPSSTEAHAFVFPGRDAYPRYEGGVFLAPKAYDAEPGLTAADRVKLNRAVRVAHRYADINAAFADGFRLEERYGWGMGVHMHNLDNQMADKTAVDKPGFLTYVRGRENGKWQLIQLGYIHRGLVRQKMFDSPKALGHFHKENMCVAVRDDKLLTLKASAPCDGPGERRLGPIWMMHFAVSIHNREGLFADNFVYADHASMTGTLHTFFGRPVP